jgi:hypothetical protein
MHELSGQLVAVCRFGREPANGSLWLRVNLNLGVTFASATLNATVLASKYPGGSFPEASLQVTAIAVGSRTS